MAGYLAVTDKRTITADGRAVIAKEFVPRTEYATGGSGYGISPQDYGAVGDGVANDSAAVQAALDAASWGGLINLSGRYYMGSTPISAVLKGPLSIQGHGTAKLVWDTGNGILLTQNDANHTVTIDGLTLLTRAKGLGVALEVVGTNQNATGANLRPRSRNRGSITRVNVGGEGSIETDGWAKGIRLVDVMNFFGNQIQIDGYAGPVAGSYVSTHGIEMITDPANAQAVDVAFSQVWVFFVQYALDVQGYEGVMVDQSTFIAVGTGFRFDAVDSATPLVTFTNGQVAFINKGFDFKRTNQGVISGSLIYIHANGGNPAGTGVALHDVTTTRVTGCTFVSNVGMLTGVGITGNSILNVVEDCTFYANITNPVNLSATTSKNRVHNLNLGSSSQVVINLAGTANFVEGEVLGFYGTTPAARPQLPASPTVQQLVDALKAVGLIGQA